MKTLPGETPITDFSELRVKGITTRGELSLVEAENIRKAVVKYLAKRPSRRVAPFDVAWFLKLHKEMLGDVWKWAGRIRTTAVTVGCEPQHIETRLLALSRDLLGLHRKFTALPPPDKT